MANLRATHGSERIRSKLSKLIESSEYYEAHQLYRTLHFRYINCQRFRDLENLLYDGAILFLNRQQYNSGADLALLYLDTLTKDSNIKEVLNDDQESNQFANRMGELLSRIPSDTPERMKFIAESAKLNSKIFPMHLIQRQFALVLWKEKNYADSRRHFLHCNYKCGEDCALMLIEYHISCGYPSEVDLFIAQFILQLLCIKISNLPSGEQIQLPSSICSPPASSSSSIEISHSLNLNTINHKSNQHAFANIALQCYLAKHPQICKNDPPFLLPLINFLWFLLLAIESGKTSTFNVLCDRYEPVLSRDPAYKEYLQRIGELYFGFRPRPANRGFGGLLGNFLQSFMEDNDESNDDEEGTLSEGGVSRSSNARNQTTARISQASEDLD